MKKIILLIYATLLAFLNSLKGFAYDIKTHKDITKATINSSVVSGYLQNYLGIFPNDLFKGPAISRNDPRLEIESTYSAFGWMEEGAGSEDEYLQNYLGIFPNDLFKGPAISRNDPRLEIESTYSAFGWMEEGAGSEDEYLQLNLNTFL